MGQTRVNKNIVTDWNTKRIEFLAEMCQYFDDFDVNYFLDGGTLLGLTRDGNLIPNDDDHDFCVRIEDIDQFIKMLEHIKTNERFDFSMNESLFALFQKEYTDGAISADKSWRFIIQHKEKFHGKKVFCDIIVLLPFNDFYFYKLFKWRFRYKAEHIYPTQEITKFGINISVPGNKVEFLDVAYDCTWRTPQRFKAYDVDYWCNWKDWETELPKRYKHILKKTLF